MDHRTCSTLLAASLAVPPTACGEPDKDPREYPDCAPAVTEVTANGTDEADFVSAHIQGRVSKICLDERKGGMTCVVVAREMNQHNVIVDGDGNEMSVIEADFENTHLANDGTEVNVMRFNGPQAPILLVRKGGTGVIGAIQCGSQRAMHDPEVDFHKSFQSSYAFCQYPHGGRQMPGEFLCNEDELEADAAAASNSDEGQTEETTTADENGDPVTVSRTLLPNGVMRFAGVKIPDIPDALSMRLFDRHTSLDTVLYAMQEARANAMRVITAEEAAKPMTIELR